MWQRQNSPRAVSYVGVDLQIRPVLRIGRLPLHLVAFKLATVTNERRFGCQGQHLGLLARPVVVHALGVFSVTHQTRHVQLAVDLKLVTNDAHDRDPLANPILLFQHLVAVGLAPLDPLGVYLTLTHRLNTHLLHLAGFGRAFKGRHVAGVQVQCRVVVLDVVILSDTHGVLVDPDRDRLVAHALRLQGRDRACVGKHALVFSALQVFGNEAPLSIRAARVLDGGVHVNRKRVAYPCDLDVLIERVVVAILGQDADVTFAVAYLVLAGGVVGDVGIRDVLDVPDHAVVDFGDFWVGVVVSGYNFAARTVLSLVVCDLSDMLRQLVDRQCRTSVDRLPLHCATGGQNICRPLPVVVRRACIETQVV